VAPCWQYALYQDARYGQKLKAGKSFRDGEHYQCACERAQRRFLRATQTMATEQRLLVPVTQINVASRQRLRVDHGVRERRTRQG